ncbi:MAG: family 20 glycosylhydrolase [Phycisphaeraceae bacterium]
MIRQIVGTLLLGCGLVLLLRGVPAISAAEPTRESLALVPWPKSVKVGSGAMNFAATGRIAVSEASLAPLGKVLAQELFMLSGRRPQVVTGPARAGDIALELSGQLKGLAQQVQVTADRAIARGGTYDGAAMASVSLLQLVQVNRGQVTLPSIAIDDEPGSAYCGTMLDVARQWHPAAAIKPVIQLCRLYKIHYLHLHLTDNQLFTFPSAALPNAATEQHYTLEELKDLVRYGNERGVILVPEIEMPGHTRLDSVMPEIFGAKDANGKDVPLGVLNIANDAIYPPLEALVGEVCDIFTSSPYFHMGGDETNFSAFEANPSVRQAMQKNGLRTGELFTQFINRINAIVKKRDKQLLIWEGFGEGSPVDKDVIVLAWHGSSHRPQALIKEGYKIINVPWIPSVYSTVRENYEWNIWRLNLSEAGNSVQLDPTPSVLGGQMVLWERGPLDALPMLRFKAPARQERVYAPHQKRSYEDFAARLAGTDALLQRLLFPVTLEAEGLLQADEMNFDKAATIRMATSMAGATIRYTLNGGQPTSDSPVYKAPVTITRDQARQVYLQTYYGKQVAILAQAFDDRGQPLGEATALTLRHDEPRLHYALYRPARGEQFAAMPDFARLKPFEEGVLGRIGSSSNIQRGDKGLALRATATFLAEGDGEYAFSLQAAPAARLLIGGTLVCEIKGEQKKAQGAINLTQGPHDLVVEYYTNDGQIRCDVPIEKFPVRTKHHWEDRGLYEWLVPLKAP